MTILPPPDLDRAAACNPNTDAVALRDIATRRPDLDTLVAAHPQAYPELISWLASRRDVRTPASTLTASPDSGFGTTSNRAGAGSQVASFGLRIAAYLLDSVVLFAAAVPLGLMVGLFRAVGADGLGVFLALIWWAAALAYMPVFVGLWGQTIGQRICHIQVVDIRTGTPIGIGRGVVRWLVLWFAAIPFGIVYFSPLFDSTGRMRGWHDLAADSIVLVGDSPRWPSILTIQRRAVD